MIWADGMVIAHLFASDAATAENLPFDEIFFGRRNSDNLKFAIEQAIAEGAAIPMSEKH